jgi:hypothetical protein
MREIKFRAWDKKKKIMAEVLTLIHNGRVEVSIQDSGPFLWREVEDIEIMQYTGIKDKNGKEVYEGDVFSPNKYWKNSVIAWMDSGRYMLIKNHGCIEISTSDGFCLEEHEIIGNLYENPELIEV